MGEGDCMKLIDKYRPQTFDDVCGQEKALATIRGIIALEGQGGQAWYFAGPTGTGKTTLARILARQVAPDCGTWEYNAADVSIDTVREIGKRAASPSLFGGRAWVINEAHLLSSRVISAMLDTLEVITEKGKDAIIFTTTWDGADLFAEQFDGAAFAGRCNMVSLTSRGFLPAVKARLLEIAKGEGIAFGEEEADKLLKELGKDKTRSASSMRDAIQEFSKIVASRPRMVAVA